MSTKRFRSITRDVTRLNESGLSGITAGTAHRYLQPGQTSTSDRWLPSTCYFRDAQNGPELIFKASDLCPGAPGLVRNDFIPESRSAAVLDQTAINPTT